jgi:formate hydrogenlyase subunit 3/multisubunit Na+/H+ antiporter MnhD subunit
MMFLYEGNEFISFLLKPIAVVFFSGIIAIPIIPARIKPVISVCLVFIMALVSSALAVKGFKTGGIEFLISGGSFFGDIPLRIDGLTSWFILIINYTTLTGVMSGVIVKMGIYGIFRIITFLKSDSLILGESIITLSLLTGLFGIMNAAVQRDFKKMLAYLTIENIGIIGIGIGLGLIGIEKGQPMRECNIQAGHFPNH